MGKKLYVSNLAFGLGDREVLELFERHGPVDSVQVIRDRDTGGSRGFGFVQMQTEGAARAAIAALHGKEVGGRALSVCEAQPREPQAKTGRAPAAGKGGRREVRKRPPALGRRLRRPPSRETPAPAVPQPEA